MHETRMTHDRGHLLVSALHQDGRRSVPPAQSLRYRAAAPSPYEELLRVKGADQRAVLPVDRDDWRANVLEHRAGVHVVERALAQTLPALERYGVVNRRVYVEGQ